MSKIVERLRDWRTRNGLNFEEAGKKIGTSKSTWFAWETGAKIPSREKMLELRVLTRGEIEPNDFYDAPEAYPPPAPVRPGELQLAG